MGNTTCVIQIYTGQQHCDDHCMKMICCTTSFFYVCLSAREGMLNIIFLCQSWLTFWSCIWQLYSMLYEWYVSVCLDTWCHWKLLTNDKAIVWSARQTFSWVNDAKLSIALTVWSCYFTGWLVLDVKWLTQDNIVVPWMNLTDNMCTN